MADGVWREGARHGGRSKADRVAALTTTWPCLQTTISVPAAARDLKEMNERKGAKCYETLPSTFTEIFRALPLCCAQLSPIFEGPAPSRERRDPVKREKGRGKKGTLIITGGRGAPLPLTNNDPLFILLRIIYCMYWAWYQILNLIGEDVSEIVVAPVFILIEQDVSFFPFYLSGLFFQSSSPR